MKSTGKRHKEVESKRVESYTMQTVTRRAGVAVLISDVKDLQIKTGMSNTEKHFTMPRVNLSKRYDHYKHIYIKNRASNYIKQKLTEVKAAMYHS